MPPKQFVIDKQIKRIDPMNVFIIREHIMANFKTLDKLFIKVNKISMLSESNISLR